MAARLTLDGGFEARQRIVPLNGDAIQKYPRLLHPVPIERPVPFPAASGAVGNAGGRQNVQMLGHGLASDSGA